MTLTNYLELKDWNNLNVEPIRVVLHVTLQPTIDCCIKCEEPLVQYYIESERRITLLNCELHVTNKVYKCANPDCKTKDGKWLKYKSGELATIVLPKHLYGLDVLLKIGELRFQKHYTIHDVIEYLYKNHGIQIKEAEVYRYQLKYLELFKGLQDKQKQKIKCQLAANGGYIMAVDGTCSNGSGTLYIIRDEMHGINLDAKILRKGNPEDLENFINSVIETYGMPIAAISDAEWGLFSTLKRLLPGIPVQYCQRHFLNNLGADLMGDSTNILNKLINYKLKKRI